MRLLRLLQSARSAPEANFTQKASKVPKLLHCRSKLKISKTAWLPRVQIPKPLFGGANLPKAQNSSKFSVSQNHRGRVCGAAGQLYQRLVDGRGRWLAKDADAHEQADRDDMSGGDDACGESVSISEMRSARYSSYPYSCLKQTCYI